MYKFFIKSGKKISKRMVVGYKLFFQMHARPKKKKKEKERKKERKETRISHNALYKLQVLQAITV